MTSNNQLTNSKATPITIINIRLCDTLRETYGRIYTLRNILMSPGRRRWRGRPVFRRTCRLVCC